MLDKLLGYIRRHALLRPGDRVGVAVSSGADSVALLRLLLEAREQLGLVLSVVHFNHKIRGVEADADQQFVRDLAAALGLEFHSDSDDTPAYSAEHKLSLEAAGRKLRYAFFDRLTADGSVHRVATAHTRDDQAETVLLRFLRGTGTRGLAGIYPGIRGWVGAANAPAPPAPRIIRPLLEVTRAELRSYLESIGQPWREDVTNLDVSFARNRLRHEILPVLRQLNPNLDHVLSEMAEIARVEEDWWNQQTNAAQKGLWTPRPRPPQPGVYEPPRMRVDVLLSMPLALQRRLIRMMVEEPEVHLDFHHVEAVLALAGSEPSRSEKVAGLPNGVEAVRQGQELWFRHRCQSTEGQSYSLALRVPGEWEVVGRKIRASLVPGETQLPEPRTGYVGAALLEPGLAKSGLIVRNWHAGDRYQPSHTAAPKKLKELLQSQHIPRGQKPFWPVVVSGDVIVWVPGFSPPDRLRPRDPEGPVLLLEEVLMGPEGGKGP